MFLGIGLKFSDLPYGNVAVGIRVTDEPVCALGKGKLEEFSQSSLERDQPCDTLLAHYSEGGNQLTNWLTVQELNKKPSIPLEMNSEIS